MDFAKLNMDDIRAMESDRLKEVEFDLRKEICMKRMDVYAEKGKHVALGKKLKKNLARLKTVVNENKNKKVQ